jgi:hypothetical protein
MTLVEAAHLTTVTQGMAEGQKGHWKICPPGIRLWRGDKNAIGEDGMMLRRIIPF